MTPKEIKRISVIGAGLMGHGIAQEFALAGYEVCLQDLTGTKLKQAVKSIEGNVANLVEVGLVVEEQAARAQNRIRTTTDLEDAAADADLVVEAVFENLELKREIFARLDESCPNRTILASNSSTIVPSKLASATRNPIRVLVAHYFNPPWLIPLVEIVRSPDTSDEAVSSVFELLTEIGKTPVIVRKEAPGFIANRLQGALMREALSIVERGIATPREVDVVIKNGFGRRLATAGVFELADLVGWDLILAVSRYLQGDLESSAAPSQIVREKVERGELGVKTGKGFYEWTPESAEASRARIAEALVRIAAWSSPQ
jgi:3-hydroxybutyryl-CoA dehydrogenase